VAELLNPYIAGAPVTDARMFFGREDVFDWIERSLAGRYADHILVIHGQRRVGKTSVLKQLPNRLPERYIPVFFDLQGRTHTTLDRFLWWLAREVVRTLKQDRGAVVPVPEKDPFSQDPEYLEGQFLPGLEPHLRDHILLLTFDEFDNLEEAEIRETLGRPLVEYLRRLMGNPRLNFIFSIGSSGRKLENMQASYTEFFKAALYKKVSFLDEEDAFALITRPVGGVLEYDPASVRRIYAIASGHPYFTQLLCHELFSQCQKTGARRISENDVRAVLDDVVERGTVNLKFVWDEASDLEKWCLAALAQMRERVDNRSVEEYLHRQRVRFTPSDLEAALLHLRQKDVLAPDNHFVVDLMRLWLQKNRPVEQVREELTEVNPIANRYIEIGLEYLESGLHEKAIGSFQEALKVDGDNLGAIVHIGQVYLRQQAFAEAVSQFEQALSIDEEDVTARAGLCQAHLALGDEASARGRVKEAQRSYQQILTINPEHTDARQRMADIFRQLAERSLADHKDEEALSAFRQALAFTPEDEALEARVLEVQEQKRAAVLAALRDRSDQALRERRWEQAIASLEEGLALEPDDPDLLTRMVEARAGYRTSRLAAERARANDLGRAEQWDEALRSWAEYLALEPEDREAAQGEIARLEKARSVAQAYAQAQAALAKKDYDCAIGLLKAIVVEDEGYKNASRLMTEAIEARRARQRFWQGSRVRERVASVVRVISVAAHRVIEARSVRLGFGIGLGLVVVAGASLALMGYFQGVRLSAAQVLAALSIPGPTGTVPATSAPAPTVTPKPDLVLAVASTPTSSPTPTARPTVAATPQPDWVTGFAQPILDAIASRPPDFQDDFDDKSGLWQVWRGCGAMEFLEGELVLRNCSVYRDHMDYPDIVAELDCRFLPETTADVAYWGLIFRTQINLASGYALRIWHDGRVEPTGFEGGQPSFSDGANPDVQPNHLLLIAKGSRFAFYVNDRPLTYVEDDRNRWGTIVFELPTGYEYTYGKPVVVALDSFRLWDISDVAVP
jgi:tetratricopeptide (TPR) repeat protein